MDLTRCIVLVTGGSQGIGRAVRIELQRRGATVVASSLSGEEGTEAVDIRDPEAVAAWVHRVATLHGRIDVVVHCAGIAERPAPAHAMTPEDFDRVLATNLSGAFHVLRVCLPVLRAQKSGMILALASRAARKARGDLPAYSASKAGLLGLCQSVARDCELSASGIACITVSPGGVNTPMRTALFGKEDSEQQQSPESVAAIIADLAAGVMVVPNGADVVVMEGKILEMTPML